MSKTKLQKLNVNYSSDPNIGVPRVYLYDKKLTLTFKINPYKGDNHNAEGEIVFINCVAFRVGAPNDEGYTRGSHNIWNSDMHPEIEWNSFYEVISDEMFNPEDFYRLGDHTGKRHFVFFMKEATFECFADDYREVSQNS